MKWLLGHVVSKVGRGELVPTAVAYNPASVDAIRKVPVVPRGSAELFTIGDDIIDVFWSFDDDGDPANVVEHLRMGEQALQAYRALNKP